MSAPAPRPLLTQSAIGELLARYRHLPRKTLGQNFVADPNTIRRIVALAGVTESSSVVEIGPGLGSLTLGLTQSAGLNVLRKLGNFPVLQCNIHCCS